MGSLVPENTNQQDLRQMLIAPSQVYQTWLTLPAEPHTEGPRMTLMGANSEDRKMHH